MKLNEIFKSALTRFRRWNANERDLYRIRRKTRLAGREKFDYYIGLIQPGVVEVTLNSGSTGSIQSGKPNILEYNKWLLDTTAAVNRGDEGISTGLLGTVTPIVQTVAGFLTVTNPAGVPIVLSAEAVDNLVVACKLYCQAVELKKVRDKDYLIRHPRVQATLDVTLPTMLETLWNARVR